MKDLNTMKQTECIMSNFDHGIERAQEKIIRNNPNKMYGQYAGLNFCGYVYFTGSHFVNQVWVYNHPQEEIKADTLEELMKITCNKYGGE